MSSSQNKRIIQVYSANGDSDDWMIQQVEATDAISESYCYQLTLLSTKANVDPKSMLHVQMGFGLTDPLTQKIVWRYGYIARWLNDPLKKNDRGYGDYYVYRAELRPAFWFLQQTCHSRIFQNKSIVDIVQEVAENYTSTLDINLNHGKVSGSLATTKQEYCVQYEESDFNFISRLLEQAGIFYYFVHNADKTVTLQLGDGTQAYASAYTAPLSLYKHDTLYNTKIQTVALAYQTLADKVQYNHHDFTQASAGLSGDGPGKEKLKQGSALKRYHVTNGFTTVDVGNKMASMQMQAEEARYNMLRVQNSYVGVGVASQVNFDEDVAINEAWVVTRLQFYIRDESYTSAASAGAGMNAYSSQFEAVPATVVFSPLLITPRPSAPGMLEAVIVGADEQATNTDINVDDMGRHKVQFYWYESASTEQNEMNQANQSCWLRAMQHWHGCYRVETPVLVGFIQNDLNRPVILGPVYDSVNKAPVSLPDKKDVSSLTRMPLPLAPSSTDTPEYNALTFDDTKEAQLLTVTAPKDMQVTVANNSTLIVNKGDVMIKVEEGKYTLMVTGALAVSSKGAVTVQASGAMSLSAGGVLNLSGSQINLN